MSNQNDTFYKDIPFIKKDKLIKQVKGVLDVAKKSLTDSEKKFYKNSVDSFSALFDSMWQDIPIEDWVQQEKARQNQKTLQNALGNFHQSILGSFNGWEDLGTGKIFDIINGDKNIIAEVKNKYNTTKGNHKVAIYDDLKQQLDSKYKGYTAYYVEVIPKNKKTYNKPFTPSDNRTHLRRPVNESIRVIDGKSFYALASDDKNALEKIYLILPSIIKDILGKGDNTLKQSTSFKELFNRTY